MQTSMKAQSQPSIQGQCRQRQYNISRGDKKSTATRWIPKNMGHHKDHYWAWVPKSILHPEKTSTIATNKTAQQRWFKQGRPRTNNTQGHPDVLHQNKQKWIPKDQRKEMKKQVAKQVWHSKLNHQAITSVTSQESKKVVVTKWNPRNKQPFIQPQSSKASTMGDQPPSLVTRPKPLRFKALDLQLKLFGPTSVLCPRCSWIELVRQQQGYTKLASTGWQFRTEQQKKTMQDQVIQHQQQLLLNIVNKVV